MAVKDEGGPAFPQALVKDPLSGALTCGWDGHGVGGMSLRAYYAGQALSAYKTIAADKAELARHCVEAADALIEALKNDSPTVQHTTCKANPDRSQCHVFIKGIDCYVCQHCQAVAKDLG